MEGVFCTAGVSDFETSLRSVVPYIIYTQNSWVCATSGQHQANGAAVC